MAGRVVAHLFVADLEGPEVAPEDRHHLERVLRLRPGEAVTVSDGRGGLRRCLFAGGGRLEPAAEIRRQPAPSPPIGVGFALVKGERPEWIVQKLTECGVDRIVPFVGKRSVVRWEEATATRNLVRWRRIAHEAAMQSRRTWLPVVEPLVDFAGVVAGAGGIPLALAEPGGDPPSLGRPFVLVGPEGGWSDEEREATPATVGLGPSVLRTETAAMAAGVLLAALRSKVVVASTARP